MNGQAGRMLAVLLAAACAAGPVSAQDTPQKLTLEACIRMGLSNSAAAARARLDQAIAECTVGEARAEAIPQLSLSGLYTRLDVRQRFDVSGASMAVGSRDNYAAAAEASQLLYSGGRVGAALRAAHLTRRYADESRQDVETALIRDIRVGFAGILFARAAVAVREQSVEQLRAQSELVERKFRAGTVSEFDAIVARVRLANETPALIDARNALATATAAFRRLIAAPAGAFEVEGELKVEPAPGLTAGGIERLAVLRRPALQQLATVVRLREQDVAASWSKALPSVRARAGYAGSSPYGYASEHDWEWHWNAGFTATWDVWDGGLTRYAARRKRLQLEQSRTDLEDLRRIVRLEAQTAWLELQRASEALAASEGTVELAEKALAIAKSRYDSELATLIEFTDSNLALSTARLARHQALRDHVAAVAQLRYVCGLGEAPFPQRDVQP